jgi:tetratricopeptide (TPR) repeat protein
MISRKPLLSVLQRLILICAIVCGIFAATAQDVATAFNEANRLYEQQNFAGAAAAYEKIIHSGTVSVPLYFNLGNAWFKAGQTGGAIAAYRSAAKLAPRDPDVRANLRFARDTVQNVKPPKSNLWTELVDRLTVNEWTIAAAIALTLTFLLLAVAQWKREWTKNARFYATIVGAFAVVLIVCTAASAQRQFVKVAVIAVDEAVLRRGPFDESQSAYTLRDGAELTVLDQRDQWVQVADTANRIGWLRDKQIQMVQ